MNLTRAFTAAVAGAVFLGVAGIAGVGGYQAVTGTGYYQESAVTATVNDKAIQIQGSGKNSQSVYMIYTTKGVFTDSDSLVKGKFNSSDVYNALEKGCTYTFNVHGWRNHFFSMYKNIDSQTFVPTKACPVAPKIG